MLEAVLKVGITCPWISELSKHAPSFKILSCRPCFKQDGASAVITLKSSEDPKTLQSIVSRVPNVVEASFRKVGKNRGVGFVKSFQCPCSKLGINYSHVLKISVEDRGMTFHLLMHSKQELNEFLARIKNTGTAISLVRVKQFKPGYFLTPRQEQALVHAFIKGYFESPRPASVNKFAEDFGVSTPTYTELLRRALAKLVLAQM
ncbi:MAG: helix-turn-helix domain-containing protein [Candidatus Caldarchaeum sp.]